jgi:hypothetical protein
MKTIRRIPFREIFMNNPFSVRRAEPAPVSWQPSTPLRPVEIRRHLRQIREHRQYGSTVDY